ncbi:MAG: class I SAM-dependent methyltransferase [Alphaproteobacteria bacterium]|nr:class I SAM-dependent methyltransferase [Alphaproteobacteria bacterium]
MSRWELDFFDLDYAALALSEPPSEAELDAMTRHLGLRAGDLLLEQGCGVGRIARALAARGVRTLGVDLVPDYVEHARALAEGLPARFVCADVGDLRPEAPARAVINWNSSYAYQPGPEAPRAPLRAAFDALAPGGRFGLETSHDLALLRAFQPRFVQRYPGVEVVRDSRVDLARGLLCQTWTFTDDQGRRRVREGHRRLLSADRLVELVEEAGFVDVALMADLDGAALELDSPRVLLFATRPA